MGTGLPDFFSRTWSTLIMKFIDLQDAPISYLTAANKNVRVNTTETEVEFGGAYLEYGLIAAIGAAGRIGRMYWATDTKILYRDDGVDWVEILRGEAISRLASLAEKAHASLSGVSSDQHHVEIHAIDGAKHTGTLTHAALSGVSPDQHHAGVHAHVSHTGIGADDHHPQIHTHDPVPFAVGGVLNAAQELEVHTNSTSMVCVKQIRLDRGGTIRTYFELKVMDVYWVYGQIYRNGVAVGTLRSTISGSYVSYTEDISGWAQGDTYELYIRCTTDWEAYIRRFRLYASSQLILCGGAGYEPTT